MRSSAFSRGEGTLSEVRRSIAVFKACRSCTLLFHHDHRRYLKSRSGPTVCAQSETHSRSGRRERTDRDVKSVRISERKLLGLSVRIHVWPLFEPRDERAGPLKRQVEIIDTEEQQEAAAGRPAIWAYQRGMLVGARLVEAEQDSSI